MLDLQKWKIAVARFNGYCANLPPFPKTEEVGDYHAIVAALEEASGHDLSSFKIPPEKLRPKLVSVRPAPYGGRGQANYSRDKYCDPDYFQAQIHALKHYLPQVEQAPPKTQYDDLHDWQLEELMVQRGIKPPLGKGDAPPKMPSRDYIIAALVRQDHPTPVPTRNTTVYISGSNVNYGSPGASISGNIGALSKEEFANIVDGLRKLLAEAKVDQTAQNELNINIGTIELQLNSSKPNKAIIREALTSAKAIAENAAGSLIASGVIAAINHLLMTL